MSGRKDILNTFFLVLSVSLITSSLAVLLVSRQYSRHQFDLLNVICGEVLEQEPEAKKIVSAALKEYTGGNDDGVAEDTVLSALGYRVSDFPAPLLCPECVLCDGWGGDGSFAAVPFCTAIKCRPDASRP